MGSYEFQPPTAEDYSNVTELNHAWLAVCTELRGPQRTRLAHAPFLLFSLREQDLDWWHTVLDADAQGDLLYPTANAAQCRLQSAALAYLWQLSMRNPYAARLISGADVRWCELLTRVSLMTLIDRCAERADLCVPRLVEDSNELFDASYTSSEKQVRRASQFSALQSLLTGTDGADSGLRAAACRMPRPRLRVADLAKE